MNKFFTIPNLLTLSRIFILPLFALGFFAETKSGITLSLIIFIICCITDYLDGYYARAYAQSTKLGQMLDPLADKILISISILFLAGFGMLDKYTLIPASIILCREIIVSGIRNSTMASGKSFKTTMLSKWKTATQMIAIMLILLSQVIDKPAYKASGDAMLWVSSIIALISGAMYCKNHIFTNTTPML